jgi:hypothetical protein
MAMRHCGGGGAKRYEKAYNQQNEPIISHSRVMARVQTSCGYARLFS